MMPNVYALYKGDDLLGIGTAKELAEIHGVKPSTIKFYATPVYHRRSKGSTRRITAMRIKEDE